MDKQNRKSIMNIIYLFSGFVLVSIIGGVVFISMSYMETDANRYKKKRALEEIDREYAECRGQETLNQQQREDLIFKCVNERENKKDALTLN